MIFRRIFASMLFKISKRMINVSAVSLGGYGLEEMPESMKKLR